MTLHSEHATRLREVLAAIGGLFDEVYEEDPNAATKLAGTQQTVQEELAKAEQRSQEFLPYSELVAFAHRMRCDLVQAAEQHLPKPAIDRLAAGLPTVEPKVMSADAERLRHQIDWSRKLFNAAIAAKDVKAATHHAKLLCRTERSLEKQNVDSGVYLKEQQLREWADSYVARIAAVGKPIVGNDDAWADVVAELLRMRGE